MPQVKCPKCGHTVELSKFLGWPVSMWWEIRDFLAKHGAPKRSPLSILSELTGEDKKS